ncbi:hypothetical protein [Salimicrobium jeotgali]|uniref:hypothetical protein n=1 Tax=Salimicrobium jeotgali TaxID=1230341 RepID=UPI0015E12B1E|nr:hypothetical protein [Salimicrobium jeotgali]
MDEEDLDGLVKSKNKMNTLNQAADEVGIVKSYFLKHDFLEHDKKKSPSNVGWNS